MTEYFKNMYSHINTSGYNPANGQHTISYLGSTSKKWLPIPVPNNIEITHSIIPPSSYNTISHNNSDTPDIDVTFHDKKQSVFPGSQLGSITKIVSKKAYIVYTGHNYGTDKPISLNINYFPAGKTIHTILLKSKIENEGSEHPISILTGFIPNSQNKTNIYLGTGDQNAIITDAHNDTSKKNSTNNPNAQIKNTLIVWWDYK